MNRQPEPDLNVVLENSIKEYKKYPAGRQKKILGEYIEKLKKRINPK